MRPLWPAILPERGFSLRFRVFLAFLLSLLVVVSSAVAQGNPALRSSRAAPRDPKLPAKKRFVLDVVRAAVALPQSDNQDRLRVLNSAATVVAPINGPLAKSFAREGARLEAELINAGETPRVSLLASGQVDCTGAVSFVQAIPAQAVQRAEQSLLGALGACPRQTLQPIRQKLDLALNQNTLAARALLAVMERTGQSSRWSQDAFAKMFDNLPHDADEARTEAPNFAAMFVSMAPALDKDIVRKAGIKFLEWLAEVKPSGERNLAVNMMAETLKNTLGDEGYTEALRSSVMAQGISQTAGQPGEIEHPTEESVSVLEAMDATGKDRTEVISKLPPSLRAREAAAHGFADGTTGDRKMAERYFDMAFSAVDEVWNDRDKLENAPAVVEEVSEAAAQVDAVAALKRAQRLQDPSAQAISMLAVARVALGQD